MEDRDSEDSAHEGKGQRCGRQFAAGALGSRNSSHPLPPESGRGLKREPAPALMKTLAASDTLSNTISRYTVAERNRTSEDEFGVARHHCHVDAIRQLPTVQSGSAWGRGHIGIEQRAASQSIGMVADIVAARNPDPLLRGGVPRQFASPACPQRSSPFLVEKRLPVTP